jgi:hypothetical protein
MKEKLHERIRFILVESGKDTLEGFENEFFLVESGSSLETGTTKPEDLPKELVRTKIDFDREAIKAKLKNGEPVGDMILTPTMSLRNRLIKTKRLK